METIDISEVKEASRKGDRHWFDPDTMRFFRSRVASTALKARDRAWFVSSEQFVPSQGPPSPRLYSVRCCDLATGRITTAGEFQEFRTSGQASAEAKRLAGAYESQSPSPERV